MDVATTAADLATGAEGEPPPDITTIEFREGFCQHIVVVTGRCVAGPGEALMSAAATDAIGIGPGSVAAIRPLVNRPTLVAYEHEFEEHQLLLSHPGLRHDDAGC